MKNCDKKLDRNSIYSLKYLGSNSKCKNCDQTNKNSSSSLNHPNNKKKSLPSYYFPTSSSAASSVSTTSNCSRYVFYRF